MGVRGGRYREYWNLDGDETSRRGVGVECVGGGIEGSDGCFVTTSDPNLLRSLIQRSLMFKSLMVKLVAGRVAGVGIGIGMLAFINYFIHYSRIFGFEFSFFN